MHASELVICNIITYRTTLVAWCRCRRLWGVDSADSTGAPLDIRTRDRRLTDRTEARMHAQNWASLTSA